MKIDNLQLYDYLLLNNLISPIKLKEFFKKAQVENRKLSRVLVEKKVFSQSQMLKMIANISGLKFVDLAQIKISDDILKLIPRKLANKFLAIVFEKNDKMIKVAVCGLENSEVESFLKRKNSLMVEFYLTDKNSIQKVISDYIKKVDLSEKKSNLKEDTREQRKEKRRFAMDSVNEIILNAISDSASEIQIEKKEEKVVVSYRLDGVLVEKMFLPSNIFLNIIEIIKTLAKLNLSLENAFQSGNFSVKKNNLLTFFQVSIIPEIFSERIILRLDDNASDNLSLEKIGLDKKGVDKVYKKLNKNKGLILIASQNGDGKTTTFYTILQLINFPDRNIATIEDPIEKIIDKVNQTKVDLKSNLNFKTGLLSILNQDPDFVGVGEILDESTLDLVLTAAEDNMILSTMYGKSVFEVIENIYTLGSDIKLASENLKLIVAQKLSRKLCVHCRERYFLTEEELSSMRKKYDLFRLKNTLSKRSEFEGVIDFLKIPFYRSKGCKRCDKTGYFGKVGLFEVLELSDLIKNAISKKESLKKIREIALNDGFESIEDDAFCKVTQGIIDFEELEKIKFSF